MVRSLTTATSQASPSAANLYDTLLRQLIANPQLHLESVISQRLPYDASMDISTQLTQIDQLKAWLDSFRPLPQTAVAELKERDDVRFTYQSNAIEGNTLTQSETELVLSKGITIGGKTLTEHLEVIGHKEAIDYIETLSQAASKIGEWEIRQMHGLILRRISPTEAGRYRQIDVKAAGTNHVYPPHYLLPGLMADFAHWLIAASATMHPIKYASEAHYRFVSIHPFADGNGRTGRLLMNLLLLQAGFPIVSISNQKQQAYIDALSAAQQSNSDTTQLTSLICEAAYSSLVETLSVVAGLGDSPLEGVNQHEEKGQAFYQEVISFLAEQYKSPSA